MYGVLLGMGMQLQMQFVNGLQLERQDLSKNLDTEKHLAGAEGSSLNRIAGQQPLRRSTEIALSPYMVSIRISLVNYISSAAMVCVRCLNRVSEWENVSMIGSSEMAVERWHITLNNHCYHNIAISYAYIVS